MRIIQVQIELTGRAVEQLDNQVGRGDVSDEATAVIGLKRVAKPIVVDGDRSVINGLRQRQCSTDKAK